MVERHIVILDYEEKRLAETTRVLQEHFGDVDMSARWIVGEESVQAKVLEGMKMASERQIPALLSVDISGIERQLVQRIQSGTKGGIHFLITSDFREAATRSSMKFGGVANSDSIGYAYTPFRKAGQGEPSTEDQHRMALEKYLASLPEDHPFSIGSRSTT